MSSLHKNLSQYDTLPDGSTFRFMIIVSQWNTDITYALRDGCINTLKEAHTLAANIDVLYVPGSFELTTAAGWALEQHDCDAVICLGCVIQGETRHFEFICNAVANGLTQLSIKYLKPAIFGVLTTDTMEQAHARAGGQKGNKGIEAAATALQMVALSKEKF